MEKTVKVIVDIKIARTMLGIAGFSKIATSGTDEEVFAQVLDMMTCYGAKTEVLYDAPESTYDEYDALLNTDPGLPIGHIFP